MCTHRTPNPSRAFTLVEILIVVVILGVLAAIVIPLFTNASVDAQRGNVKVQIQSIRNQIQFFRVKNNGSQPALVGSGASAFADLVSPPAGQNAYLRTAPANPRNGSTTVIATAAYGPIAVSNAAAVMDPAASGQAGWLYNPNTGDIAPIGFDDTTDKWYGEP
jgi:prepilin-type N-terminal cleavage/methylation domain-containing protein